MEPISDDTPLSSLTVGQLRAVVREETAIQFRIHTEASPARVMSAFKEGADRLNAFATRAQSQ